MSSVEKTKGIREILEWIEIKLHPQLKGLNLEMKTIKFQLKHFINGPIKSI